ncbi:uncharacterized protein ARMOST_03130 [Armillaria ostoyae]|uniref:Luciferase domain-containing protein n=1 Tax=Armillaria ostoyae TaxID=47428 RepID=A0A284QTQ2_ARMOS|nr:uncharacterized protein ARMOST_03130 [Armillaria ostoyae]
MKKKLQILFDSIGKKNSTLVEYRISHTPDHLLHVVLAPQDCKQVIEKGWCERHPFSSARRVISLPKEYLMIYGPRDDEELAIIGRILKAGVGYMTNNREVI